MCMLPVLGPKYLRHQHKVRISQHRYILNITCSHNCRWKCEKIRCLHSYPSLYLKCLKAKFITSWISPSKRGWRGIWIKRECCNFLVCGSSGAIYQLTNMQITWFILDLCTGEGNSSKFILNILLFQSEPYISDQIVSWRKYHRETQYNTDVWGQQSMCISLKAFQAEWPISL